MRRLLAVVAVGLLLIDHHVVAQQKLLALDDIYGTGASRRFNGIRHLETMVAGRARASPDWPYAFRAPRIAHSIPKIDPITSAAPAP